jgi:hypothetical protein
MKNYAIVAACIVALLSLSGCACCNYVGKGKAPPPVVTKG